MQNGYYGNGFLGRSVVWCLRVTFSCSFMMSLRLISVGLLS